MCSCAVELGDVMSLFRVVFAVLCRHFWPRWCCIPYTESAEVPSRPSPSRERARRPQRAHDDGELVTRRGPGTERERRPDNVSWLDSVGAATPVSLNRPDCG